MTGSDYESPNQTKNAVERRRRFNTSATISRDGNISITICDDSLEEDPESFEVYITDENLQNAFLFPYRVAMVTIVDNDKCEYKQHYYSKLWYHSIPSFCSIYDVHVTYI